MTFSDILSSTSFEKVENLLRSQMNNVDLIGQLEIDRTSYNQLMKRLSDNYHINDLRRHTVPAALFLTSMVFCARYSNEHSRKFWEPYARIWKQSPDAVFQRLCREHFIKCSKELSQYFGFDFPKKTAGDVVRPVYYHTLIPAHLKDEFASWLNQMLPDFMRMDIEQIANDLEYRTYYIAPTLKAFLNNDDTQPAALTLIAEMLDAVRLFQDGEQPNDIWNYLSSVIEREIWEQLLPNIRTRELPRKRTLQPKIEWIWDIDNGRMLLRIRDIVSVPEFMPYELVISHPNQSIYDSNLRERIYAWEKPDGTWYIDEHIIEDVADDLAGYQVCLVDNEDNLIHGSYLLIPPLPSDDIVFFRITQQDVYAIPVPKSTSYPNAEWIVLLKEKVSINSDIPPFYMPDLLESSYSHAVRGDIQFPLEVTYKDGQREQLESRFLTTISATLHGEKLENISRRVPPIFTNIQVQLRLNAPEKQVKRLKLQIEQDGRIVEQLRLSQIEIQQIKADDFMVDLEPYLHNLAGKFTLNLVRGISSILSNPIQFSILRNVELIESPSQEAVYYPDYLPSLLLQGTDLHRRIDYDKSTVLVEELITNKFQIHWTNLQKPLCSLIIDGIPLTWEIQRVCAWIEHDNLEGISNIKDLGDATLSIHGLRHQNIEISVNDRKYSIRLDASGKFNTRIEQDRLFDLLKAEAYKNMRLEVHSEFGSWVLWEHIGTVSIEHAVLNYDIFSQIVTADVKLSYPLSGRFEYRIQSSEKQWFLGYHNSLQLTDTLRFQIPVSLHTGQYNMVLLYRGTLLLDNHESMSFHVKSIVDSLIHSQNALNTDDKLRLLSLRYHDFKEISDDRLQRRWSLLRYIVRVRNTTDLLPAWAVTENVLSCNIIFAGAVKPIILFPEKASHKGYTGVGKTPLIVHGDLKYAYACWEMSNKRQSIIRFWLPQGSPPTYWDLEPDDMYPVYYSKRSLHFYAIQGYPSPQEISENLLVEVGYGNSLPCEIYPGQRLLQHSLKAHYVVDRRYLISRLDYENSYKINKPQATDYRSAIDNFLDIESDRTNRKRLLRFIVPDSEYRKMLDEFENTLKSHSIIANTILSRVTMRFIQSALLWSDDKEHNYYHLDRLVMLLSLVLRLRAYYPYLIKDIDNLIPQNKVAEMILDIEHLAPELFIWSLTWVEQFAQHAVS